MSKEEYIEGGKEGKEFHDLGQNEKVVQDLSILLTITGRHDDALPTGCMTSVNLACLIQERSGVLPYQILVLNDKETLVEFEQGSHVVEVSQALHGAGKWGELDVDIGCVISGKASLLNIYWERESQSFQQEEVQNHFQAM